MPFNLLLLPLVGGYVLLDNSILWPSFYRYKGNRLLFASAIPAIFFLTLSFFFTSFFSKYCPDFAWWWETRIPFQYSGTSLLSFILPVLLTLFLNLIFKLRSKNKDYLIRYVEKLGTNLDVFLYKASLEKKQVALTLANNKVYIGFLSAVDLDLKGLSQEERYLSLLPSMSGYRHEQTKELKIATEYSSLFQAKPGRNQDDFIIVIPLSEILTFTHFDIDTYAKSPQVAD